MLSSIEVVRDLYRNHSSLLVYYDIGNKQIARSRLVKNDTKEPMNSLDFLMLKSLGFLLESNSKRSKEGLYVVEYVLSKKTEAMMSTIDKFGVLRLENNYRGLDYLSLAKLSVIMGHATGGMVDFKYNGVTHTVRKNTTYKFFEDQYKLSEKLQREKKNDSL